MTAPAIDRCVHQMAAEPAIDRPCPLTTLVDDLSPYVHEGECVALFPFWIIMQRVRWAMKVGGRMSDQSRAR